MALRLVCAGEEMIKKSHLGPLLTLGLLLLCEWHMCVSIRVCVHKMPTRTCAYVCACVSVMETLTPLIFKLPPKKRALTFTQKLYKVQFNKPLLYDLLT